MLFLLPFQQNVLAMTGGFGRGGDPAGSETSPPKDKGALKKWLNKLADALKLLAGITVETFSAIVGSVIGAVLSFFARLLDLLLNIPGI